MSATGAVPTIGALALAVLVGGCAAGPDFKSPAPPAIDSYLPARVVTDAEAVPAATQNFLAGAPIDTGWWHRFGSPGLDALVDEALRASPTVSAAQAALRAAEETAAAQRGAYLPQVSAALGASRQRNPVDVLSPTLTAGTPVFNLYTPQVTVGFTPDVFGTNRRAVEGLAAQADLARWQLQATYQTLIANVAAAAIAEAGLRAQIAATEHVLALGRESVAIARRQLELGAIAEIDVIAQEAALAQLAATLPGLRQQEEAAEHQLAALTGHLPGEAPTVRFDLDALKLPAEVPLGVPSELVRQRPDVRAAEANLHAASAAVGVATGNLLPQLSLTGSLGSVATGFGGLFETGANFWSLGANLSQTLFAGGELVHRRRAAVALFDQAGAQYRQAVLLAFQNVADSLRALEHDAEAVALAERAAAKSGEALAITRRQQELGAAGYLALITAEQSYSQALVSLAVARTARFADTVALFQALGGADPGQAAR
jgi:NodT family efflux transporter outer membrane factor (OMF) lipoprotein